MKVGLYTPFLAETIGGGERYLISVAECFLNLGFEVDLIIQSNRVETGKEKEEMKMKLTKAFGVNLEKLKIINGPFGQRNFLKTMSFTKRYDIFYYLTDGSFFVPCSRKSAVHFMIPFAKPRGGFFNQIKLKLIPIKTTNSYFTKRIIEKNWGVKIDAVHGGVVDTTKFKTGLKQNIILNVGRFFTALGGRHCKRQDVLIEAFKEMYDQGLKDWRLVLVGAVDKGEDNLAYAEKIAYLAKGYPIALKHAISQSELCKIYGMAKIYWHATGFRVNEEENPEAMEHLGISTLEAMAAAAVPVVIKKGGQREIVTEEKNGLFWETKEELIEKTMQLIKDKILWKKLSTQARKRAKDFSREKFCTATKEIFAR